MQTVNKIRRWVETAPERLAYSYCGRSLSYLELWQGAERLSSILSQYLAPSVVLFGEKEPELLIGMLACLLAGKTYVPLSVQTPSERFRQILDSLGDCTVLSESATCPFRESLPIRELLALTPPPFKGPVDESAPAYVIFTSGSSGVPKGVPISRKNLDNFTAWIGRLRPMQLPAPARVLNQASFSFDLSVADIYFSLCGGHTLYGMPPGLSEAPEALFSFLRETSPQAAVCTPTFLKLCLTDRSFAEALMPELRVVYSCGEILENATAEKLLRRFPKLRLINAYGPTEATSAVCAAEITRELAASEDALPVGVLEEAACRIEIVDGEIVLKGDSVFSGYLDGRTGGYYTENGIPCFRTGDLGSVRNGSIYCQGRGDRQVKWKGYRVELDEIEQAILSLPAVSGCAVLAKKTNTGVVRMIKAFIVTEADVSIEAIRKELEKKLPDYMIPRSIQRLREIPVTENGKTDRKRLEAL